MTRVFYIFEKSWGFYVFDLVPFFLHQSPELQELTLYGDVISLSPSPSLSLSLGIVTGTYYFSIPQLREAEKRGK